MTVERATPGAEDWAELAAPHLARYLMVADLTAGRRVLDAGSGAGYGAAILCAGGAGIVLSVDYPIVSPLLAAVYGRPRSNLGVCRRPVSGGAR